MIVLDDTLKRILTGSPTIAMVGASPNEGRPSNRVMRYLLACGYQVIPVRPRVKEILGRPCFPSLEEIAATVDIVDVFRRPEACPEVAASAVAIGAKVLWLQEGIVSEEAAAIARQASLEAVMDTCIMKVIHDLQIFPGN